MNWRPATTSLLTILTFAAAAPCANLFGQETGDRIPLNLATATTAVQPPRDFDPLQASGEDLAEYGFPPRPDSQSAPRAYGAWKRAMRASGVRIVPELETTEVFAGATPVNPSPAAAGGIEYTANWSGAAVQSGATSYNNSSTFYYVEGDYVVPAARQVDGVCDGGWDREMSWVGIDGLTTANVVKAGTESDAYCSPTTTSARYYAWFEWYPHGETQIKNFPIHPGDDLFVEVWQTSATQAHAYLVNFHTNMQLSVDFTAPTGVSLIGKSAEWIVERPRVNGTQASLPDYTFEYFSACLAVTEDGQEYLPNSGLQLIMMDDNGNALSTPEVLGADAIWLQSMRSIE